MKIKKSKDGSTSVQILPNQKIKYDPNISSYVVETNILDELYNKAWEGGEDDDPHMPKPNTDLE